MSAENVRTKLSWSSLWQRTRWWEDHTIAQLSQTNVSASNNNHLSCSWWRWGTSWIVCQSLTGPHTFLRDCLMLPINPYSVYLEYLKKTCKLHKEPSWDLNQGLLSEARVRTSTPSIRLFVTYFKNTWWRFRILFEITLKMKRIFISLMWELS